MRNISAASLAKLATKVGTEPVTLIEIQWTDFAASHWYAGKDIPGIAEGRLLATSAIDDVVNYSNAGTSQSVTVTLNDTDNKLLTIFGNVDIHKRPVKIWQWFEGIPFSDKFLLFAGIMASPIQWKEGERIFTFTILSRLEDFEVGFAPEEGFFPFVPDAIIGKAWPLVFGNVMRMPCIPLDNFPSGGSKAGGASDSMTKDSTGIHDPSLDKKILDNQLTSAAAAQLAQLFFIGYLEASFTARKLGELGDLDPIRVGNGTFSGLAKQYLDQGNKYLLQSQQISTKNNKLQQTLDAQKAQEKNSIGVTNGSNFPQGRNIDLNVAGSKHSGFFVGDTYFITDRVHPDSEITQGMEIPEVDQRIGDPVITRSKFFFMNAGTPLLFSQDTSKVDQEHPDHPVRYVVASGIAVTVQALYAYRTVDGLKSIYGVPPQYYQVIQTHFGTLPVTMIYMLQPLSTILGSNGKTLGYENEIWATVLSPVGPNTVDILKWLISTYSKLTYDPTTFASVHASVAKFPMNFAVMDQPNLIKLVQDIAYQARCIVWMKDNVFFIKYLPRADAPVATITEAEVLLNSLEVSCTATEDLITKYTATWTPDHLYGSRLWKTILRYNILFYGLHEQTVNYFCFNQLALVQRAATFWMIRTSNTYKTLIIKVPFTHLNIETLDTILLTFSHPFIAKTSIPAVVTKATIDTTSYEITLELWLPVRIGEMIQYNFAYPADLAVENVFPTTEDQLEGRAGATNELNKNVKMPTDKKVAAPMSGDQANGGQLHVSFLPLTWGDGAIGDSGFNTPDIVTRIDSTQLNAVGQTPPGTSQYQYDEQKIEQKTPTPPTGVTLPGFIDTVNDDNTYDVNLFFKGVNGPPTLVKGLKQLDNSSVLKAGGAIMVSRIVWQDDQGKTQVEYDMQSGAAGNSTFAGIVSESNGDGTYIVDVYERGAFNPPKTYFSVRQVVGDNTNPLSAGTGVMVTRVSFVNDDNTPGIEQTMQAPVWSP